MVGVAPQRADAAPTAADGPILKPLPSDQFVVYGTNAEMRWDSVDPQRFRTPQPRLFVRNHTLTPRLDPHTFELSVFGDGLGRPRSRDEAVNLRLRDLRRLPVRHVDHGARVHRQRSQLLRHPAGDACVGHAVEARRRRDGHLGRGPARRRAASPGRLARARST